MTNKDFNKIICNRISELRKKQGLKIEQLAYQSGISKGGLSEIERCMKEPRILTIFKLCCGLGITTKEFFDFKEIDNFSKRELSKLLKTVEEKYIKFLNNKREIDNK